jgi:transposase
MSRRKSELIELDVEALYAILERTTSGALSTEDRDMLKAVLDTFVWLTSELEKKNASLARLRKELSISTKKTEKAREVLKGVEVDEPSLSHGEDQRGEMAPAKKKERKGHGRNGADAYSGAEKIAVPHESLKPGQSCPDCEQGKLRRQKPRRLVRVMGQAPLSATVLEIETLRCDICGKVFRAEVPAGIGEKKYDEAAASMIALLKYGSGLPFYRLARLEGNLGIPLPAATQWDVVAQAKQEVAAVYDELIRQGAEGEIFYNDDTAMKILDFLKENEQIEAQGSKERTGMFTSGIVSTSEGRRIALFFTGREHAGENLARVLERRTSGLDPPMQMCDGLSRNLPKEFETLLANCLTHGRRKFVEIIDHFPQECHHVIKVLAEVYKNDAATRDEKMSAQQRLAFHQAHSAEFMDALQGWMAKQIEQRKVEPNSSLGEAIAYMLKRWDKLTLFLRKPGAPLDNNICERALKKAILHRKNALFYKTENGAQVGDVFMSLIYTAELSGANPFHYLTALLKHTAELRRSPHEWMPWNYQATLAALDEAATA